MMFFPRNRSAKPPPSLQRDCTLAEQPFSHSKGAYDLRERLQLAEDFGDLLLFTELKVEDVGRL